MPNSALTYTTEFIGVAWVYLRSEFGHIWKPQNPYSPIVPAVTKLLSQVSEVLYLLKEEAFSVDIAQTCTNVRLFQKLLGFHLFHIVNHLR